MGPTPLQAHGEEQLLDAASQEPDGPQTLPVDVEDVQLFASQLSRIRSSLARFRTLLDAPEAATPANILATVRSRIWRRIPAYKPLREVARIEDIPLIDKRTVLRDWAAYVDPSAAPSSLRRSRTSGTSGQPLTIVYDAATAAELKLVGLQKMALRAGLEQAFGRPVFAIAIWERQSGQGAEALVDPLRRSGLVLKPDLDLSTPAGVQSFFKLAEAWKPALLTSRPNVLELLAAHAVRNPLRTRPLAIFATGAALSAEGRRSIEQAFGCPVFIGYAMREFGVLASECPRQDGLHVDTSLAWVEAAGPGGSPCAEGEEGELVVTSASNEAMPLLRYRTGDRGILSMAACRCGRAGPRIMSLSGRAIPNFRLPSGEPFSPTAFSELLRQLPILEIQVTQTAVDRLEVRVELPAGSPSTILDTVRDAVARRFPAAAAIEVQGTVFPKDGKFQRYRALA